jgi:hypothetical protein
VSWVDCEPVGLVHLANERAEARCRHLDDGAALAAHKVTMSRGGKVVGRGAVAEMRVLDDPEPLQLLQVAVDRREVDVGSELLDRARKLLRGAVPTGLDEASDEESARRRDAMTRCAQQLDDLLDDDSRIAMLVDGRNWGGHGDSIRPHSRLPSCRIHPIASDSHLTVG